MSEVSAMSPSIQVHRSAKPPGDVAASRRTSQAFRLQPARGHVAVVGAEPALRDGLCAGLEQAGFATERPDCVHEWTRARDGLDRALVVVLDDEQTGFGDVHRGGSVPIVAVVTEETITATIMALRIGAAGVVGRHQPVEQVVAAVSTIIRGGCRLPLEVARTLASRSPDPQIDLDDDDIAWLRLLAEGTSVVEAAAMMSVSRRAAHRQLRAVFDRLHADNRHQAVVAAVRSGLI